LCHKNKVLRLGIIFVFDEVTPENGDTTVTKDVVTDSKPREITAIVIGMLNFFLYHSFVPSTLADTGTKEFSPSP
jgi:hypothetical protein